MRIQTILKASLLALAMSFTTGCVTDDDGELTEEEMLETEEEATTAGEDPEYEYEEEEEEESAQEEEWNGLDPDMLEEEAELESQELLEEEMSANVVDGTLDDPTIDETLTVDDTEWVDPVQPAYPQPEETLTATQGDLKLTCTPTGAQDMVMLTTRYGCKAYLKKSGKYYGIIKGWWQVTRSNGTRIPIKDLTFRDGEFDATFSVPNSDAIAGVKAKPWR